MSPNPPTSHPLMKMGFRQRWQAKFILSPYPIQAAGFTLIELSIVLVIIGLITGGVLVGRDLIKAAQIRTTVSQVEKINASVNTFRVKYNCLPGDCKNATMFFAAGSQPEQVQNGDDDGWIAGVVHPTGSKNGCTQSIYRPSGASVNSSAGWLPVICGSDFSTAEWLNAWDHLAAAGISVSGIEQFDETSGETWPGTQFPKLEAPVNDKNGNTGGIIFGFVPTVTGATPYLRPGHKIQLGTCGSTHTGSCTATSCTGTNTQQCGLNAWEAKQIDLKMDDGKPFSGSMVNLGWNKIYSTSLTNYNHNLNETRGCGEGTIAYGGTNEYQTEASWAALNANKNHACASYIKAAF